MNLLKRYAPVLFAIIACWAVVAVLTHTAMAQTGGSFVYPLDDTYIHMALARTLAVHRVWGVGPQEFSSASSSPGWTLLLAAANLLFGTHLLTPFFLNLLLAAAVLIAADAILTSLRVAISAWMRAATLLALMLLTPLPSLVLISMEHIAQMLGIVILVGAAVGILATGPEEKPRRDLEAALIAGTLFAACIRYEAVFAIAPVCLLLLARRRFALTLFTAIAAAIPPMCFGLYFHRHSGFWLPFSVLMKATLHPTGIEWHAMHRRTLLLFMAAVWLLRSRSRSFWSRSQLFMLLSFVVLLAQVALGLSFNLLRYEDYAVGLAVFALCMVLAELPTPRLWPQALRTRSRTFHLASAAVVCLALLETHSLLHRAIVEAMLATEESCVDRFHEHIQMARLIHTFYDHDTVVLNDIGAVAFYTQAHILDIAGLASAEPLHVLRSRGKFTSDDVALWASSQGASLAILQDKWPYVAPLIPASWTRVGIEHFPRNVAFPDLEYALYAPQANDIQRLCSALSTFSVPQGNEVELNQAACKAQPTNNDR